MRIMFVSSETPLFPAGGIATYLEYMISALTEIGHEVFLFTFRNYNDFGKQKNFPSIPNDRIHIEWITDDKVHLRFPSRSHNQSVSFYLAERMEQIAAEWNIDVIESTDWQSPCLAFFQNMQAKHRSKSILLSVYNHGLSEFIWEADQLQMPQWAQADCLAERQQMRVCDLIVIPSNHCKGRLKSLNIETETSLVREPYVFQRSTPKVEAFNGSIQYMGRVSIGKGMDKLVYAANILNSVYKIKRIEVIGRVTFTTFQQRDIIKYMTSRLHEELRERFSYTGFKPRDVALDLLIPGAISPHLGSHETFSYACVEAIDAGQIPAVRFDTPMAEFFPEELSSYILDSEMRSVASLQKKFEKLISDGPQVLAEIQNYCRGILAPENAANTLSETYGQALDRKREWRIYPVPQASAQINDITVLIPAYKPNHEFMETIDSIAVQSGGTPNVLICDDGTPESHQQWFEYARARIPICKIIHQPNSGLLAARNSLVDHCKTPLSIFLDTDDILAPSLVQNLLNVWNDSNGDIDAVIPQRRNFGETNELILRHTLGDYIHFLENDYRMTALIRTDILAEIGFDATRRNGEGDDWVFWLDFHSRGYKATLLPEAGFLYRFRKGSMSWPWSEGQHVGTQSMIRDVIIKMCMHDPNKTIPLSRSMFSRSISKV